MSIIKAAGSGEVSTGFYPYGIDQSLRFEDGSSAYLNRTPAAGNRKTWTYSFWVKKGNNNVLGHMLWGGGTAIGSGTPDQNATIIRFASDNKLLIYSNDSDSASLNLTTTQVFRDVGTWMHLLVAFDTTQSTNSNRIKLYVNGSQVTSFSTETYPSQNYETHINENNIVHIIGCKLGPNPEYFYDGYLSDINFVDGQALDPTSFGEAKDGTWIPKSYSGSYGTNGFHLDFNGNSNDTSGNSNNWTANNISAHDYVPDSPTNNFAVFNPLRKRGTVTYSEGNLQSLLGAAANTSAVGSFAVTSGKWYFEARIAATTGNVLSIGVEQSATAEASISAFSSTAVSYYGNNGNKYVSGTASAYGASYTSGDVVGVAFDLDSVTQTIEFFKNGTSQGSINLPLGSDWQPILTNGTGTGTQTFVTNFGQDSTFSGATTAGGNADGNGIGDFAYAPPSGYLALCTANLPTPSIVDGSEYFNTVLYTGNESSRSITGVGFSPDFVWFKARNAAIGHLVYDTVRGAAKYLQTVSTSVEGTGADSQTSFDSDGFSLGADTSTTGVNQDSTTYVAWNWKAGTSFSNSAGTNGATIASSGSVNTDAGFSIVSFDFQSTGNQTIGHSLGVQPSMIIMKSRDSSADAWWVYHESLGASNYLRLNSTNNSSPNSGVWSTTPTNQVFTIGSLMTTSNYGTAQIAYCFANSDIIKVGSYTGNGSTDGPMVFTGGKPAWIMWKRTDSSTGGEWVIQDTTRREFNPVNVSLYPNLSNAEATGETFRVQDTLSNGFKLRSSAAQCNASGGTYIYLCILETPLKHSNAR